MFGTIQIAGHRLPGIWQYMLPEEFMWLRLPKERHATCDRCPKVITGEYRSECRCCTYFPHLPNFMLGLGLKDPDTERRMISLVEGGFSLPEGTPITPGRLENATALYSRQQFGRCRDLICPFLLEDGSGCGIYPYRNSVCAAFFCETDHGAVGQRYWEKVQALVGQVETALAQWCMAEVGIDLNQYIEQLNGLASCISDVTEPDTGAWTESARQTLFGDWFGKELRFFEKCADLVMSCREDLYEIACSRALGVAFAYERAVEEGLDAEQLREIDLLPENPGQPIRVANLWYQLDLATKRLWEIPFNEAEVSLHNDVRFEKNAGDDALSAIYRDKPLYVEVPEKNGTLSRLFLSEAEVRVLRLFGSPRIVGEALLETAEMQALDDAKAFLAECLRRQILIV